MIFGFDAALSLDCCLVSFRIGMISKDHQDFFLLWVSQRLGKKRNQKFSTSVPRQSIYICMNFENLTSDLLEFLQICAGMAGREAVQLRRASESSVSRQILSSFLVESFC